MLPSVPVPPRPLQDYLEIVGEAAVEELRAAARALSGARILNLNSTAFGGGVAELLVTHVGLLNELGLDAHWQVINGTSERPSTDPCSGMPNSSSDAIIVRLNTSAHTARR